MSSLRYNNVIPRLHAQQVTAAMGVNRVFLLAGLIDAPLAMNKDDDQDDFHINHRQVDFYSIHLIRRNLKTNCFRFISETFTVQCCAHQRVYP